MPEHEPAARGVAHRRRLLGQQGGTALEDADDAGSEPDLLGPGRTQSQRGEAVGAAGLAGPEVGIALGLGLLDERPVVGQRSTGQWQGQSPSGSSHRGSLHRPVRYSLRSMGIISQDVRSGSKPDRNLALELVRVTESAALAASRWVGRGDKLAADGAAVDAMRLLLDTVPMDGVVVIGEGEKDEAPMLYNGENIGDGSPPVVDIAVDPLEGTTLTARGFGGALAVIALSERGSMFDPGPCVYMEKLAAASEFADLLNFDDPIGELIAKIGERKGGGPEDVTLTVLDRERHDEKVAEIREAGATIPIHNRR